jgi:hypothetical protein
MRYTLITIIKPNRKILFFIFGIIVVEISFKLINIYVVHINYIKPIKVLKIKVDYLFSEITSKWSL